MLNRIWKRSLRKLKAVLISDREIVRRQFYSIFSSYPDLDDPKTFSEKIQWLKLYYRPSKLTEVVDKFAVREFVEARIGGRYLNSLLGAWGDADEIDLDSLPDRFVIKATHGSGMNLVCFNKSQVDWDHQRLILNRQLRRNYYAITREWAYKNVQPRLVAEAFLGDGCSCPADYKFFCFDGIPRLIQVDLDRFGNHTRAMLDVQWNMLPFELQYSAPVTAPPAPSNLNEMLVVAAKLSVGFPFTRIDLYSVDGCTIFGEMTFYPGNGMECFKPCEWDERLGEWLQIPKSI